MINKLVATALDVSILSLSVIWGMSQSVFPMLKKPVKNEERITTG
jgi:hypothetical protein